MKDQDFTMAIRVDQSPEEVVKAIADVRGWWSANITGNTDKLNGSFVYRDKYLTAKMKITAFSTRKIVWEVVESHNTFFGDQFEKEWDGTKIVFDISRNSDNQTEVRFTQCRPGASI